MWAPSHAGSFLHLSCILWAHFGGSRMFFFFFFLILVSWTGGQGDSLLWCFMFFLARAWEILGVLDQFGDFHTLGALKIWIPHPHLNSLEFLFPCWTCNPSSIRHRASLQLLWAFWDAFFFFQFPFHKFNRPSWQGSSFNTLTFSNWESCIFLYVDVQFPASSPTPL